ncbi:MAG: E2/UBC family protein [Alteraurantiacibacter sp. bin_em_oilr2.035]|nr:E2/UBC family protein [Alteraurantiacibacter sp. bin_em_oilr2.035]
MSSVLDMQLDELRERFGQVEICTLPSGTTLVSVADVRLPPGWNATSTTIHFVLQPGYPFAQPDCFWADAELRLEGGGVPQNAAENTIPEDGRAGLWFSWHLVAPWNANRDTLSTWMNVVQERMRQAR